MDMIPTGAYVTVWVIFLSLATASMVARLWVRLRILHRTLDWDDWFIIIGYVLALGEEICLMNILPLLISINNNTFTINTLINLRMLMWIQFFTFTTACWAIKFSLLAFYARLFYFAMKKTIWVTGIFLIASLGAVLISSSAHCVPANKFWTPTFVNVNGVPTPQFLCPGDHAVGVINAIGVVLSVVSDFVILALPVFRVVKLKVNYRQKCALIGVFAVGTLVAGIEVVRGAWVLAKGSTLDSIPLNLIWITLQCTLGIVVTNLPILRPLLFRRSFGSSSDHASRNGRSWVQRSQHGKGIPLYEVPEYRGHTMVTAGSDFGETNGFGNGIMKSVEVRVESESVGGSSIESHQKGRDPFAGGV